MALPPDPLTPGDVPSAAVAAPGAVPGTGGESFVVTAERLVAGGVALARRPEGKVVLVEGAYPGERVRVRLTSTSKGVDRAETVEVVEASPGRRAPHCAHVDDGCGGCDLALLDPDHQRDAKVEMVRDGLRRLGRVPAPEVRAGPALAEEAFRTTMRLAVTDGRAGLRALASHDVVALDHCVVAHPLLDELVAEGRFGEADEVVLRVGASTGERLALVRPTATAVSLPDDVVVVGADELAAGRRAWIHEELAGRRWRISAGSFFQTRADGARALVDVVREMTADVLSTGGDPAPGGGDGPATLVDAYCGVGLFSGALLDPAGPTGASGWRGLAVERNRSSVADARHNLSGLPVRVVGSAVERFRAPRADVVVADPARSGLGRRGVEVLAGTGAARLVLVSCDVASAGRDVALLAEEGYRLVEAVVVDLFPHTHHVEVVSCFDREPL
ncbi:class I SAM-dependent RNA methyltransferase [Rhabdothermincola salaria]|uniref:class I SAM-dependent RNA methyltransferase n=1 Tax=Rhabdothermincola salaria TaxID=2903142 RepID=UPI001E52D903|nr:hypothetical protein [Rhabdothermincola salaria]MCD9623249.1 hypothetical protein [Rhabdothermincola salaria]